MNKNQLQTDIIRFLAEIAAMATLKGRWHSLGEDLGERTLKEFLEMCGSNGIKIQISIAKYISASFGEHEPKEEPENKANKIRGTVAFLTKDRVKKI